MPKKLCLLLCIVFCICLCACGDDDDSKSKGILSGLKQNNNSSATNNNIDKETTTEAPKTTIEYLSSYEVDYDEKNKQYNIFFTLKDSDYEDASASGTVDIKIIDDDNYTLYDSQLRFTDSDFSERKLSYSKDYACALSINESDIEGASTSDGTIYLNITLDDGTNFEEKSLSIYDLPEYPISITLPSTPTTYKYDYYGTNIEFELTSLEYNSELGYGGAKVVFNGVMKLVSKDKDSNKSSNASMEYKIYDSSNLVVDSGSFYSDSIAVGESSKVSFTSYYLNPRETYTLKIESYY